MKSLRKRLTWLLMTLFLLPILIFSIWYGRQVRQDTLDHALIAAIKKQDTQTAIGLLNQGANANAVDKPKVTLTFRDTLTEFWHRLQPARSKDEQLIYNSALFVLLASNKDQEGFTIQENVPLTQALLAHRANVNAENEYGDSVLMAAAQADAGAMVILLLQNGADPHVTDASGNSPLMFMIVNGQDQAVKLLLDKGADPNLTNQRDYTPLGNAIEAKDLAMVQWLLQKGANPNAQYNDGNCVPLKVARKRGVPEIVRALQGAGAKE